MVDQSINLNRIGSLKFIYQKFKIWIENFISVSPTNEFV